MTDAIAVIGAGAWGTALAARLATMRPTTLWARAPHRAAEIQVARENTRYLPGHAIPDALTVTADAGAALRGKRDSSVSGTGEPRDKSPLPQPGGNAERDAPQD